MDSITIEQATKIAENKVLENTPGRDFIIFYNETKEYEFGWVFSFAPRKYAETRSMDDLIPGLGPLVVDRDGKSEFLTTSVDPAITIPQHLKEWQVRQAK